MSLILNIALYEALRRKCKPHDGEAEAPLDDLAETLEGLLKPG
jgi:hypothetical protein